MNRENVAKLAVREEQKLKDAEEDKRLMKEYQERLDRQEMGGNVVCSTCLLWETVVLAPYEPHLHRPRHPFKVETS